MLASHIGRQPRRSDGFQEDGSQTGGDRFGVAVSISIAVVLIGEAAGFPEFGVERVSQVLCFGVFVGVYRATRRRSVPPDVRRAGG